MFLGYQDNKIKFYTAQPLNEVLYNLDKVEETDKEYVLIGDEYVLYDEEQKSKELAEAKQVKYDEANTKAREYLESGEALFELEPTKHIEATDGNIGKFSAYALGFVTGTLTESVSWTTKEDEVVELNQEQVMLVLQGLGTVQAVVWNFKFPYFLQLIEEAQTVEDVNNIEIDYRLEIEQ